MDRHRARLTHALVWGIAGLVPAVFLGVFFLWPVASLVLRGLVGEAGWTADGLVAAFSAPRTWRILAFTIAAAAGATALSVLVGVPGALVLYRRRFAGRDLIRSLVTVPFVLPTVVVGVAFAALFDRGGALGFLGLEDHWLAIVLAMVFFNYSVIVRTTGTLWRRLDPRLGEAAAVLGATPARAFLTVTLPALAPAIAAGASLVFLFCTTAFGIVMVLGGFRYSTIETEIWYQTTQLLNLPVAAALSVTQLAIVTASLLVTGWLQRRHQHASRLHTDDAGVTVLKLRSDLVAILTTATVVVGLIVLPVGSLLLRSLRVGDGWGLDHYARLAHADGRVLVTSVWGALGNSVVIALAASALALALGVLVSLVASRRPRNRAARTLLWTLEGAFLLPLGVSAVTLGFGYLITLNRPPLDLRSSLVLIPIAQALVALPLVVRSLLPGLRAIDPRQLEAAATLGAGPWQVLRTIELPHLVRGLGLAAGFAFATSLGEFGATSFLSRPDNPTLPVLIHRLFSVPGTDNYGTALAAATVLALLTATVMAVAERRRPEGVAAW